MRPLTLVVVLAGCAAQAGPDREARSVRRGDEVALVCDEAPAASDSMDATPDCDVAVGGAALRIGNLLAADRLAPGRLLLLRRDLTLVEHDEATGRDEIIARAAADPRVAADGRVLYTQLPDGTTELAPGTPGKIVLVDLAAGTRRTITDGRKDASSPFLIPGADDVLFVSARTGVASLWIAPGAGGAPRQLTNVGVTRVGAGFVRVPGRTLAFEGRHAIYPTSYGGVHERWSVDLDSGAAEVLP